MALTTRQIEQAAMAISCPRHHVPAGTACGNRQKGALGAACMERREAALSSNPKVTVVISVTADDIAAGVRADCYLCPIARAARRAIPSLPDLIVGHYELITSVSGTAFAELPDAAIAFIGRFDDGQSVKLFDFTVDLPDTLFPAGSPS
jgi:hypothetical protein